MRALKTFCAAAFVILLLPRLGQALSVKTAPDEVTVYPSGARVLRVGSADLPAGGQTILFEGLPASLREDSLRLKVEGPKGTTVYSMKLREVFSDAEQQKRRAELTEKAQVLEDQKTDLTDQMASYKAESDILKSLAEKDAAKAESAAKVADLANAVKSVGKRLEALAVETRQDERAQRDLDKKIAALRSELNQGPGAQTSSRVAEAEMDLAQAGTCRFEIAYFVDRTGWTPRYDLRLRAADKEPKVELDFLAEVKQMSGEDWEDVALKLSTARPTQDSQVPDPTQWWLDYESVQYGRRVLSSASMFQLSAKSEASPPAADSLMPAPSQSLEPAAVPTAAVEDLGPATMFTIKRRASIPSLEEAQRVAVAHSEHPAELTLVAVPRLAPSAYLEAKITYSGESPLLPGPAQLFRDGDIAGQVLLPSTAPGQDFTLGFGMDERVTATRTRRVEKSGSAGLLGDKSRRVYDWDIKVSNFHEGSRDIEVREQLPRSRQDGIKVSATDLDPKPLDEDPAKPGLLRWDLKLKKGEEKALRLRYEVRWPDDQRVTGLE